MLDGPITPHEIEQEIIRICGLLDTVPSKLAERGRDAAEKRTKAKVATAKAFISHKHVDAGRPPSDETCKSKALVECEDLVLVAEIADEAVEAAKEAGRSYRAQLDALRSVAANARALVQ